MAPIAESRCHAERKTISITVTPLSQNRPVATWLFACCVLIFAMIILGGVTRLTGSGLSIVVWDPIMGVIPPLSESEWQNAFAQYQQFPEYQKKNIGIPLDYFKTIFWFEYSHRLLGRLIGVVFLVPFLVFLALRCIERPLAPRLIAMFILGGLQGVLGWYMVMSGLVNDPHVSQYRLTAHLGAAVIIYGYILWTALDLWYSSSVHNKTPHQHFASFVTSFIFLTLLSGGLVAGLKAGYAYNTFPRMGDTWLPPGLLALEPLWRNLFENAATVQLDHRVLALTTLGLVIALWIRLRRTPLSWRAQLGRHLILIAALLQITLGVSTLLLRVPIPLASAHQAGAVLLLTAALFLSHALSRTQASGKPL